MPPNIMQLLQLLGLNRMTPGQALGMGGPGPANLTNTPAYPGRVGPPGAAQGLSTANPNLLRILALLSQRMGKMSPSMMPMVLPQQLLQLILQQSQGPQAQKQPTESQTKEA